MDLRISDEQRMFREMFTDFCSREIRPYGEEIDRSEKIPPELLYKAVDQGFWCALVPEELDGAGMDVFTYMQLLEELARADMSTALTLSVHNSLVVKPLLDCGNTDQQQRYLPALATGEMLGAFALSEAGAGSDPAAITVNAVRSGEQYLLSGSKHWVSNAEMAGLFLVFARTGSGITAFLVEKETPGLQVGYREKTLGLRGVTCNTIYFDSSPVPLENRLGEESQGLSVALDALNLSRLGMGALALGAVERALEEAVRFSIEHIQFGAPIAQKQAIQNYIADAKVQVEALRYLVMHTAELAQSGRSIILESAITKLFGSRVAGEVTNKMLQVHGGYGYMKDYAIERYYRDCRALEIIEGTSQIQQFIIAREVYRQEGLAIKP